MSFETATVRVPTAIVAVGPTAPNIATEKSASLPSTDATVPSATAMSVAEATAVTAHPLTAPSSLTPARANAGLKTGQRAQLPERILKLVGSTARGTAQTLFGHPPILTGQSLDEYFDLIAAVVLDYRPMSYPELTLVKQIVDEEWKITTFGAVQKELLNAAIGNGLMEQIADSDEAPSEDQQIRMKSWRRIVFGAISGDPAMEAFLEKELGVGCLGLNVYSARHLADDIRAHIFADKTMNDALRRRDGAIQQLEKIIQGRYNRLRIQKLTAEDIRALEANLPTSEYVKLSMTRAEAGSAVNALAADQTRSGAQNPAFEQQKVTGPKT